MISMRWRERIRNLPFLLTPPIVSLLKNKWRDRNRFIPDIADPHLYKPVYSPWFGGGEFGRIRDHILTFSLVSPDRLWLLYQLAQNSRLLEGVFVECGVYKGGTAHLLARLAAESSGINLHLFDTFEGMPTTNEEVDKHREGDFRDTSVKIVRENIGDYRNVHFHPGFIPDSFVELNIPAVSFLHVDLDIYDSIKDTLEYFYDRVVPGGVIIFDDYGFESCYGARLAVDDFFVNKVETPLILSTGQALVMKK